MEGNVVTTQPTLSSDPEKPPTEISAMLHSNLDDTGHNTEKEIGKEPLSEVTAVFSDTTGDEEKENSEEEKRKRQERWEDPVPDCCCVYTTTDSDPFCMFLLCHWIGDCFRGIGACTDSCFEDCANCLSSCCEDGCLNCCCGDSGCCDASCCGDCCDGCGECLSGCVDCCAVCDTS